MVCAPWRSAALAILFAGTCAQQQAFGATGRPEEQPPPPLEEVVMQVFDKDHNGKITLEEMESVADQIVAMTSGGEGAENSESAIMVKQARKFCPTIFNLLDGNGDGKLVTSEVKVVGRLEKALKSGELRNMTRDIFDAIDNNSDNRLSASEIQAAMMPAMLSRLVGIVTEVLPLPALEAAVRNGDIHGPLSKQAEDNGSGPHHGQDVISSGVRMLDTNNDGEIERAEAGKAYNKFKKTFLRASGLFVQMGPMLTMLSMMGGGQGGGGGGGGGGAMDINDMMGALGALGGTPGNVRTPS